MIDNRTILLEHASGDRFAYKNKLGSFHIRRHSYSKIFAFSTPPIDIFSNYRQSAPFSSNSTMVGTPTDYILCADDQSLADAIRALSVSSYMALDCEGRDLGEKGGALSLISLRTLAPEPAHTYIIDVVSLGNDKLRPVFDIIGSSSQTKIVFDGRMDFSELYHGHNVSIEGALDLQLADVHSRQQRGEDEGAQLRRLSPFLHRGEINGQRSSYRAVQRLNSLDSCIKEHNVDVAGSPSEKSATFLFHFVYASLTCFQ